MQLYAIIHLKIKKMKLLVSILGWVPGVGNAIKVAHITKCAYQAANSLKLPEETSNMNAEQLEEHLGEYAEAGYDEHIQPLIDEYSLPEMVSEKLKEKSVEIFTNKLRDQYTSRVSKG